ncbi:hypothetical protein HPB47_022728 [Ixodes persulcatus]|uniref:Uncharacterized protein n=1 Tax=Ixodes persulcatus TaxID=34615 RepID=A0AC60Q8W3_IXOPE|nr:hypothetical protein HPB47_022728 [Ixodes persulcatus]
MATSTGPTPPSPHSSHPASTDQYSLPSSVCGSSIAQSEDKDTVINSAEDVTPVITSLSSLRLSNTLAKTFPECIPEIRYNSRLNLVAVDVRNGQTTRGLLRCTELSGIKTLRTGVIKVVDTTLTDEEITNNLRTPENRVAPSSTLVLFGIQLLHSKRNLSNAASATAMDTVRPPASTVLCASAAVTRTRTETPALLKRGAERAHRSKTAQNHKTEDSVRFKRHSSKQGVDLTMYRGTKPCTWQNLEEQLGNDHSILETRIHTKDFTGEARHIRITDWPAFRASSSSYTSVTLTDWVQTLQTWLNRHTRTLTSSPDAPDIDSHLLHLWEARRSLTKRWRRQRHNKKLKRRIAKLTVDAADYAANLTGENWHALCDNLNGTLGTARTWSLLRHLIQPGQAKSDRAKGIHKLLRATNLTDTQCLTQLRQRYLPPPDAPRYSDYMATVCLERLGVTNTLEELIEAHRAAQLTHLGCTAQGRALLATLGFPPCPASLEAEGLSPTARARLTVAPIPRHMNPTRHSARRYHRSRYLRPHSVCAGVLRSSWTLISGQSTRPLSVVLPTSPSWKNERSAGRSFLSSSIPIHILTDSQMACRHFLYNTLHPSTASLLDPFLFSTSHNFRLVWVPGHAAVPGNKRAHALARDLSHRAPGEDFVSIKPPPYSYSTHLAELRLARQHYPPPHPSLTRRDAVLWRQLQTNTFPTPLFYSYLHQSLSPPQCPHCGDRPNLFHMVWQCQLIPAVPPNPNPTPTSWEERLTDDTATGQQSLVDRAKAVAVTYGAAD